MFALLNIHSLVEKYSNTSVNVPIFLYWSTNLRGIDGVVWKSSWRVQIASRKKKKNQPEFFPRDYERQIQQERGQIMQYQHGEFV